MFTIALGLVVVLMGIALLARSGRPIVARVGTVLAALALLWITILDMGDINQRISQVDSSIATASIGMGLYDLPLGAILALVGAALAGRRLPTRS